MLIENLVIYVKKQYNDSNGRVIYEGNVDSKEDDRYLVKDWSLVCDYSENGIKHPVFKNVTINTIKGSNVQVLLPLGLKDKDNHYFLCELRKEVFSDVIFSHGISKGGILNGEFAFTKRGTKCNLQLIGSDEYKKVVPAQNSDRIPNNELKTGYEYSMENGKKSVYLGAYYHVNSYYYGNSLNIKSKSSIKLSHVFVSNINTDNQIFEFKKLQYFTKESETPVFSEEEAHEFFNRHYINKSKREFNSVLLEIEDQQAMWSKRCVEDERLKNNSLEEKNHQNIIKKLRSKAYECYAQSLTDKVKENVKVDSSFVTYMINKSINKGQVEEFASYQKEA